MAKLQLTDNHIMEAMVGYGSPIWQRQSRQWLLIKWSTLDEKKQLEIINDWLASTAVKSN